MSLGDTRLVDTLHILQSCEVSLQRKVPTDLSVAFSRSMITCHNLISSLFLKTEGERTTTYGVGVQAAMRPIEGH